MRTLWHLLAYAAVFLPFVWGQFVFDFGDLGGFFDAVALDIVDAILGAVLYVWDTLVAVTDALATGLNFTWLGAGALFADIWKFFQWLWNTIILETLAWILKELQNLKQWLYDHFQGLLDFLHRLLDLQRQFWQKVIRPIINLIIRLRQIATLLRLFHLHFLDRLDKWLAGIEGKLLGNFGHVRAWINRLLTYIELIIDAGGFIRRNVLLASMGRAANDILILGTGQGLDFWSGPEGGSYSTPGDPPTAQDEAAQMGADLEAKTGYYYNAQEIARAEFKALRG